MANFALDASVVPPSLEHLELLAIFTDWVDAHMKEFLLTKFENARVIFTLVGHEQHIIHCSLNNSMGSKSSCDLLHSHSLANSC